MECAYGGGSERLRRDALELLHEHRVHLLGFGAVDVEDERLADRDGELHELHRELARHELRVERLRLRRRLLREQVHLEHDARRVQQLRVGRHRSRREALHEREVRPLALQRREGHLSGLHLPAAARREDEALAALHRHLDVPSSWQLRVSVTLAATSIFYNTSDEQCGGRGASGYYVR